MPHLNDLPPELLVDIYSYLPIKDLAKVAQTCKHQSVQTSSPYLWTDFLNRDYLCRAANPADSKKTYQEIKLGLAREREAFVSYYLTIAAIHYVEKEKLKNGEYNDPMIEDPAARRAAAERQTEYAIKNCTDDFDRFGEKKFSLLTHNINDEYKAVIREQATQLFNGLLSGDTFTSIKAQESEEMKYSLIITMKHTFRILCQLGALTTINHLLKREITNYDEALLFGFKYPNINIIKAILEVKPEILNKKIFIEDEGEISEFTPFTYTILSLLERVNRNASKEIISFLLENGADKQVLISIPPDDFNGTIEDFCRVMVGRSNRLVDDGERNFIINELNHIIQYQPDSTMKMEM